MRNQKLSHSSWISSFLHKAGKSFFVFALLNILAVVAITYISVPLAFGDSKVVAPRKPPCPASLTSDSKDFEKLRKDCDYDRRLLPACPKGTNSINFDNGTKPQIWFQRQTCTKEWTVILYMALDNDLSKYGLDDFSELFWEKEKDEDYSYDVVADIDLYQTAEFESEITNQKTKGMRAVVERKRDGRISLAQFPRGIYNLSEPNTGDPQHFEEFVAWAVDKFPAKKYLLIIGGHGDGWAAMATHSREVEEKLWNLPAPGESAEELFQRLTKPRSTTSAPSDKASAKSILIPPLDASSIQDDILMEATIEKTPKKESNNISDFFELGRMGQGIAADYSHKDWLTVRDIRLSLNRITRKYLGSKAIDILAADACYMQQAEVVYELRNVVDYIYGSVPIMESQGLPYNKLLARIDAGEFDGVQGPETLATALPALMVDHYRGENDRVMASTIKTGGLKDGLLKGLLRIGVAGSRWLHGSADQMDAQFAILDAIDDTIKFQNSVIDFKDLFAKIKSYVEPMNSPGGADPLLNAFLTEIDSIDQELDKFILAFEYGDQFKRWDGRIGGLSIWMPKNMTGLSNFMPSAANSYLHRQTFDPSRDRRLPNEWTEFIAKLFSEELIPLE